MNEKYQDLFVSLSGKHNMLLTSLLCDESDEAWEEYKHLVICSVPLLTLEMAINRVSNRKKNCTPDPETIFKALDYANDKRLQHIKQTQAPSPKPRVEID